jgi:hypothetical protein
MRRERLIAILAIVALCGFASAQNARPNTPNTFSFTTDSDHGKLASLSIPALSGRLETETADDFVLQETTVINQATITGLIPTGTPLSDITNVEIEVYHIFPVDSVNPPSGNVPSRMNSPSDKEINTATRDGSSGTLNFSASTLNATFLAANSVVTGINKVPANLTHGEGQVTGEEVEVAITFTTPIILPAGHYFFRPEVQVMNGDFLYLSAPRPIVSPGIPFTGDLQAWVRNSSLAPDWLRIGTDIIGGTTTFNMTFSLSGEAVPDAGTPGAANCHGKSISALAHQFGGIDEAASFLGFSSVAALQNGFTVFCES